MPPKAAMAMKSDRALLKRAHSVKVLRSTLRLFRRIEADAESSRMALRGACPKAHLRPALTSRLQCPPLGARCNGCNPSRKSAHGFGLDRMLTMLVAAIRFLPSR